jgi:hypothetical protein
VRGSKTEYDKFQDADASYQDRESYKIVVEPMLSVYVHECPRIPGARQDWHFMVSGR